MSHLYEYADEYRALAACIEDESDEGTREAMIAQIDAVSGAFEAKAEAVIRFIRNLEADASARKAEEERLYKSRSSLSNRAAWLKEYLADNMRAIGKDKCAAGIFTARLQKNPPSVEVQDEEAIPASYWTPQAPRLSVADIKRDLSAGIEVPGARLVQGDSLRLS